MPSTKASNGGSILLLGAVAQRFGLGSLALILLIGLVIARWLYDVTTGEIWFNDTGSPQLYPFTAQ